MSTHTSRDCGKKFFDCLDRRDLDGMTALFAPDAKFHGFAPQPLDREGVRAAMSEFFSAFPDSRMPTDDIIAEEDRVAIRHSFRGTHKALFQDIPATDKAVVITGITTLKVMDGKVTEGWLNADMVGLLQQLGMIPQPS